ncbi:MAG: restriction endonuclease [Janthinobacterium lividum]
MALWGVRSGKYGEREALALDRNLAIIGWEELPNLSEIETRDQLRSLLQSTYADEKPKKLQNWESQVWPFCRIMAEGEMIVMPLKQRSGFALGRIKGPYSYSEIGGDWLHTRPVEWVREVPRSTFAQDLQYSFGAFLTVFQVARNEADQRVRAVMSGKADPALSGHIPSGSPTKAKDVPAEGVATSDDETAIDLEQAAEDGIRFKVATVFKGT